MIPYYNFYQYAYAIFIVEVFTFYESNLSFLFGFCLWYNFQKKSLRILSHLTFELVLFQFLQ